MTLFGGFVQYVQRAAAVSVFGTGGNAQISGDRVCRDEADAVNILGELVGIVGDRGDRVFAVLLENLDGVSGGNVVSLQEQHHFFDRLLCRPSGFDLAHALLGDAGNFAQPLNIPFDHIEGFETEMGHDALGGDGTDPFNQAAAQIFLNAGQGGRLALPVVFDLELQPVFGMLSPASVQAEGLSRLDIGETADDSNQLALAGDFETGNGVARFFRVECQSFDHPLQLF